MDAYQAEIDSDGRIKVPDELSDYFNRGLFLALKGEGCLVLATDEQLGQLGDAEKTIDPAKIQFKRSLYGSAQPAELEDDYVRIPHASLKGFRSGKVTFISDGQGLEIWDSVEYANRPVESEEPIAVVWEKATV